mgnify:CR=1 FL=1|jgi:hypothetical protein
MLDTLIKSLKKTINTKKSTYLILISLQIIFLIAVFFVLMNYQLEIMEHAEGIMQPLEEANYDAQELQEGQPFLKEISGVMDHYRSLQETVNKLLLILFVLFITLNGALWIICQQTKPYWKSWLKFVGISFLFLGGLGIIISWLGIINYSSIIISIIIIYSLLVITLALETISQARKSIKKIPIILLTLIINYLLIGTTAYLFYVTNNPFLMLFFALLFIFLLVFCRLFLVNVVKER